MKLDAISLEIIWKRLIAMIDETSDLLRRSSFSIIVREAHDFVVVLLDRDGNTLAQSSQAIPPFTLAASYAVKECLKRIKPSELHPGDVLISNDPWISTGHTFDVLVFQPIFLKGEVIGYAANITHWSDIGGRGWAMDSRDHLEEGLVIPICKLIEKGLQNDLVYQFIRENVRDPEFALGDLNAQLLANNVLANKVVSLLKELGAENLDAISAEILGRSEQAMRKGIARLPNGEYRYQLRADGMDEPLDLCITLAVGDDTINVDYAGSSKQSRFAINSVLNYTAGYTLFALKAVLSPETPNNIGATRPIRVTAPAGCILNPAPPAPLVSRQATGYFCAEAVLGALNRIGMDGVTAGSGTTWVLGFQVLPRPGVRPTTFQLFANGGLGALRDRDGRSCCLYPSSVQNAPIEILEAEYPLHFETKEFRPGSAGQGRYRGGVGQIMQIRATSDMVFTGISTCVQNPAAGFDGGLPGKQGAMYLGEQPLEPRSKVHWPAGEVVSLLLPGGGGFGRPVERSEERSERDERSQLTEVSPIEERLKGESK